MPGPVMIKREIIEIMDGDDDELSTPAPSHIVNTPGMSPFSTPLLRRAMDKQIARHGDKGDEDDTDSRDSSAPPPSRNKKKKTGAELGRYRTFDTSNSVGNFGILCTDTPSHVAAKEHNLDLYGPTSGYGVLRLNSSKPRKEPKPRNKADAPRESFMQTAKRYTHPPPQLRDSAANAPRSTINLFARAEQYMRARNLATANTAASQLRALALSQATSRLNPTSARSSNAGGLATMMPPPARPRPEPIFEGSSPMPAHPPPPYSANPPSRASTSLPTRTPLRRHSELMIVDTENDGDVSDSSMDTPATATRYAVEPHQTSHTDGPYFLSNLPPPPSPLTPAPQAQMRSPSSSPLSSPPPMPSPISLRAPSTETPRRSPRSSSCQAPKNVLLPPGPGEVARMKLPTPSSTKTKSNTPSMALRKSILTATPNTPNTRYGTPIRETVGRKEMMKKRVMAEPDDGSEDELA
ncbi:hypothetical protein E4T44_08216 [Aureobasidium sp. EXF-8845]|nr:hypothetical protein E4T44_08216 [Aureobasidium sp. EXF-8845]